MIRPFLLAVAIGCTSTMGNAFNYNDCILQGMKGVSSDAAAIAVRNACGAKSAEAIYESQKKFGEQIDEEFLFLADSYSSEGSGRQGIIIQNKHPRSIVTFIRLRVAPAPGGPSAQCDAGKEKYFPYKVTIKASKSVKLIFPVAYETNCLRVVYALGREPSWTDVSYSSTFTPLDHDPIN